MTMSEIVILKYVIINSIEELRRQAVRLVAAERQCYREGAAESTSLDGLTATTRIADQQHDTDMDHGGINAFSSSQESAESVALIGKSQLIVTSMRADTILQIMFTYLATAS